jgi:hypothetical protein
MLEMIPEFVIRLRRAATGASDIYGRHSGIGPRSVMHMSVERQDGIRPGDL